MSHASVPFRSLFKAVLFVSSPALAMLALYTILDILTISNFLLAYIGILGLTAIFFYPFLTNLNGLTQYVRELAEDRKAVTPNLDYLSAVSELPAAMNRLRHSFERRKQEMEHLITEREILVDSLPDILLTINEEQQIVRTNKAARMLFGQGLAGRRLKDIVKSDILLNAVTAVIEDHHDRRVEFHLSEPETLDMRAVIERFSLPTTGHTSVVITLNDVTELKRVQKMRADFVANASHEIRTPLASISGFIETLRGPARDDPKALDEFLTIMAEQSTRMTNLITDLLSLSKIEINSHIAPSGTVDLLRIIRGEKDIFAWQASQKHMEIVIDASPDLPMARGDENELRQVIHNLMGNAIKYGNAATPVTVTAKTTSSFPDDPNFIHLQRVIVVSVIDQGEGIPREHLPRLTERFYRVDSARTRAVGGTGLGLAIVKHIIHRHRGVLHIDSEVGVGSTFSVYLPIAEE
jgi:two-component system phosphate regulon sensor histidine kinase PhoR